MKTIAIGTVTKPHGFKGDFILRPEASLSLDLSTLTEAFIKDEADNSKTYSVSCAEWMPKGWKLHLDGVESDIEVKALRGKLLHIPRNILPPMEKGEYLVEDLLGFDVISDEDETTVGKLISIETVEGTDGIKSADRWWISMGDQEVAVPAIRRYISRVNVKAKKIWVSSLSDLLL